MRWGVNEVFHWCLLWLQCMCKSNDSPIPERTVFQCLASFRNIQLSHLVNLLCLGDGYYPAIQQSHETWCVAVIHVISMLPIIHEWHSLLIPHIINSSPPGQDGCHFADDIFRCIFLNETFFLFWLKFDWSLFLRAQLTITQHWFK